MSATEQFAGPAVAKKPSQFTSKHKAMVIVARHGHDILHPVTGTKIDEVKRLAAEFGVHRGEYAIIDPTTGEEVVHADIVGNFYDLDADAEAKGWTDDEKEAMRLRLVEVAGQNSEYCQIYYTPTIASPWPTYDTTHHNKIPVLAAELGLAEAAITYESANKNRRSVIEALQATLAQSAPAEELTAV